MSDRLTRKEMKQQDTFQVTVGRVLDWISLHRRHIVAGVAAVVLAVAALAGLALWRAATEDDAQALLNEAMEAYGAPVRAEGEEAPAGEDEELSFASAEERRTRAAELFERVVDEYGANDAADVARVFLGEIAAGQGDTERARELWASFVDEHPEHLLGAEVRLNLYALDRAAGRGEEVAAELQEMLEEEDRPLPEDVVLHELAVTLESLGREEEAAEHYQDLLDRFAQSPYAMAARQKTGAPGGFAGLGS